MFAISIVWHKTRWFMHDLYKRDTSCKKYKSCWVQSVRFLAKTIIYESNEDIDEYKDYLYASKSEICVTSSS